MVMTVKDKVERLSHTCEEVEAKENSSQPDQSKRPPDLYTAWVWTALTVSIQP